MDSYDIELMEALPKLSHDDLLRLQAFVQDTVRSYGLQPFQSEEDEMSHA